MAIAKYWAPLLLILAHILTSLSVGCAEIEETNDNDSINTTRVKVSDYFIPFEHCTMMVYTQGKFFRGTKRLTHGPLILLVYNVSISLLTGEMIHDKFSLVRRRNSAPHCWATFTILPEKADLGLPIISIMMTVVNHIVYMWPRRLNVLTDLRRLEVIVVDITSEDNSLLRFDYHNLYHVNKQAIGMEHSEAWYHVDCEPADCFDQLAQHGKHVSQLNKYFWTTMGMLAQNVLRDLFDQINMQSLRRSRNNYQRLANSTSFHGFFSFLILQDTLISGFVNLTPYHKFEPMQMMTFWRMGGYEFVMNDVQTFSFVSCYGVKRNSATLTALSSPFDLTSWTCTGICFIMVVLILTSFLRKYISDTVFLIVGISLENSASLSVYETSFRQKGYSVFRVYTLVALWNILIGTILTNWYKTWFTMEMIVPVAYKSPWTSVMDAEGIKILMPFDLLTGKVFDSVPVSDYFLYKVFYMQILFRCDLIRQDRKRQVAQRITATNLFNRLKPHFGMENSLKTVRNVTFPPTSSLSKPYDKNALLDYPIQPVEYDQRDSYGVIKRFQTCAKVALMDTKENIAAITIFLNDYQRKVAYVKGDGDSFFTTVRGWVMPPSCITCGNRQSYWGTMRIGLVRR
ncbi:hypothetical protein Fcan01_22042 [Folsomia candida]|uniref:Uncharacterized protein n=1 Tax=Folsomia candida TaxID=158441 RepID=A0A226DF33_FOLCA|nr:hypothetical protein Fcan01_22042 [Folsomia candida]